MAARGSCVALKRSVANLFSAYVFQRHGMHVRASLTPYPGALSLLLNRGIPEKMEIEKILEAAGAKEVGRENVLWEFSGVPSGWMNTKDRAAALFRALCFPAFDCGDLACLIEMSTAPDVESKRDQEFASIADAGCPSAFLLCRRRENSWFQIELPLEKGEGCR